MKNLTLLLLMFCLLFTAATAQTANTVSTVRQEVAQINKTLLRLNKKSFEVSGISAEGAKATAYTDKTAVRKIAAQILGETGRSNVEIYYKDDNLLFAFERQARYDKPFGKVVQNIETRFYFENGELVQVVSGKALLTDKSQDFAEARKRILSLSQKLLEGAKN